LQLDFSMPGISRHATITRVTEGPARGVYTRSEVRRMLNLSERRLRSWEKEGLAPLVDSYAFPDLVALRTLGRLRNSGVSVAKIRRAVAAVREKLTSVSDPLKELKIYSEGHRIAVQLGASRMEPISGQLLLDFDQAELHKMLSFPQRIAPDAIKAAEAARRFESSLWFEKAIELESSGAPLPDVILAYEQAVELDPTCAGALVNLGTIYFHQRKWDKAESYYRRALEADPQYALAHFNLGNLFDEKGDRGEAILHYTIALRLEPGYCDAHYNLALLFQASGEIMRAVRHWKSYLRLDPGSNWAKIARQELDKLRRATVIEGAGRAREEAGA
jgi:tetratricopeptide (TPR) repeat protein